jgi:tetratricopeptide (TPR) repeat protein
MPRSSFVACALVAGGVAAGFVVALGPDSALAQQADLDRTAWIGVKVMPKFNAEVEVDNVVIDEKKLFLPWVVQDVKGDSLLVGGDDKGWVNRSEVVKLDEASAYYTSLIVRDEHLAWAYERRAITWELIGMPELSVFDFDEQLRFEPSARAYSCRGVSRVNRKEYDEAIDDLNQAIRLNPNDAAAFRSRGEALVYKRQHDKAIADLNQALRLNPNDATAFNNRGLAWLGKRDRDKAIADFSQAIRLDPNDGAFYANRAAAWLEKKNYKKMGDDFSLAISAASTGCTFGLPKPPQPSQIRVRPEISAKTHFTAPKTAASNAAPANSQ